MRTNSRPSSRSTPSAPRRSTATRQAIAQSPPTASRTASSVSSQKRARFRSEPPYSSSAAVVVRRQELARQVGVGAVDVDDVEAGRRGRARPPPPSRPARGGCRAGSSPGAPPPTAKSLAICDGAAAGSRDSLFSPWTPVCDSSIPASAPSSCARRRSSATACRRSWSSHIRADTYGVSSDSGLIVQYSVQTAAQPPSALTARWRGLRPRLLDAEPGAVRHLVEAVSQRLWADPTGSNRIWWRGSQAIGERSYSMAGRGLTGRSGLCCGAMAPHVELLWWQGCPSTDRALADLRVGAGARPGSTRRRSSCARSPTTQRPSGSGSPARPPSASTASTRSPATRRSASPAASTGWPTAACRRRPIRRPAARGDREGGRRDRDRPRLRAARHRGPRLPAVGAGGGRAGGGGVHLQPLPLRAGLARAG